MPFFFIIIGIGLMVIGYRGTQDDFFTLAKGDFSGPGNFFIFALGIFVVGLIGYVPKLKGLSDAFLGLLVIVLLISAKKNDNDFFQNFWAAIQGTASQTSTNDNSISIPAVPAVPGLSVTGG